MNRKIKSSVLPGCILIFAPVLHAAEAPAVWLDKMSAAVQIASYEGTVIRTKGGNAEALKVVHSIAGGVISEKLTVQEGNGLEIIRNGDEVHCILPDQKSVLVEPWNNQSTLFSNLPSSEVRFGHEYDLSLVREERVAGRKAVLLAIRPHDEFRFGHRLWLDQQTGFPLKTELIDGDGSLLEQVMFADISLGSEISPDALSPSVSIENFTFVANDGNRVELDVATEWVCNDLPAGFRIVSTRTKQLPGAENPVTHILYSDGLATVSVFIAKVPDRKAARRSNVGGSNAYTLQQDEYQITAVGEVPAATAKRIAVSMRRQ